MPKLKLTKRTTDGLGPVERPTYFYDTDLSGFFLRLQPTGSRVWGVEYRAGHTRGAPTRRVTIAAFGALTPEEARAAAKKLLADVARGEDPAGQKAAKAKEMTLAALIDLYADEGCFVQRGIRQGAPMKERTKAYTLARLRHHAVPLLGKKRVTEIGAGDIERFVRDVTAGKTAKDEKTGPRTRVIVTGGEGAARKVVRDLSAVFSFAVRRSIMPENPVDKAAVRKTDNRRDRFLLLDEVKRLGEAFTALEDDGVNPKAVNIARLWALTGARRNEIAGLRWDEVDLDRGLLILADSKTGKSIRPLGAAAVTVLAGIERHEGSPFVFPAESGESHYQGTSRIWPKVIAKAGLPGVTPHTLRHTLGSTAVSTGEALALTGAILGHANARSTQIYAHVQQDPSRRAADRVSKKIAAALAGKSADVVPMSSRRRAR
ncbi:tyrosine-type recombinase/integrase [Xanthobacter sp.]|uniref:tyrosine-type recombinase/integrase n=1 Tax=Xanthobacter sp. TaxID=35809 RepID=UPI0025D8CE74|nr:tyrosine-type recombinase/integrase [Xanthobacter sp.]